jgi:threonylcarbamoyladenosine tRNA methylthiotransferase MtaB
MKVYFDTVGCRLNQAEIEQMAGQFRAAGHEILESADNADLVVVNTCSVTAAAASDSRQKVRQANAKGAKQIILSGCWATLEPELASSLPGVSQVFSNAEKMEIPRQVLHIDEGAINLEPIERVPLPGIHKRTRAFIKVQDGCDNFCTYCVTRLARGKGTSVSKENVIRSIHLAEQGGVHEVVLTGVHLGSWGQDLKEDETISDLIRYLLSNTKVERMRLSSIEPWDLTPAFFELWQNPRMCRHLHLPLQSGSLSVLQRMARHTTLLEFQAIIETARKMIPGVAITTDIMVGFPGESENEFQESLAFVKQCNFSGGHVFKYSPREGTAAAQMKGQIHGDISRQRAEQMRAALQLSEFEFVKGMAGKSLDALWERAGKNTQQGYTLHGLTDNYIKVIAQADSDRWNKLDKVLITRVEGDSLIGKIINNEII